MVIIRRWLFNLLHVPAYAVLTLLFYCAIARLNELHWGQLTIACVLAVIIGVVTEVLQDPKYGRYPGVLDGFLNMLGCALAVWGITCTRLFGRRHGKFESLTEKVTN